MDWDFADTLYLDSTVNASTPIDSPSKLRDLHFRLALESTLADPSDITVDATQKEYSLPIIDPKSEVEESIEQLSAIYLPAASEDKEEEAADLEEAIQPEFASFTVNTEAASDSVYLEEEGRPEVANDSACVEGTDQPEATTDSAHLDEAIEPEVRSDSTHLVQPSEVKDFGVAEVSGSIRTSHLIPFSPSSCSEVSSVAESDTGSAAPFTPSRARNDVDVDLIDQFERLSVTKLASGADHETAPLGTEEIESGAFETPLENPANITVELANSDPAGSVIVTPEEAWFNEREQSVVCQTAPEANDPEPVTKSVHFEEETLPEAGAVPIASAGQEKIATGEAYLQLGDSLDSSRFSQILSGFFQDSFRILSEFLTYSRDSWLMIQSGPVEIEYSI